MLALLAGCANREVSQLAILEPDRRDVLAPYEAAEWPEYLQRLTLPPGRDYVILSYLPTRKPIDLRTPETARRTLARAFFNPTAEIQAGTKIGHTVTAWQCGGWRGMVSMTGESDLQSLDMILDGWGLAPALSTFQDGHLYPEAGHKVRHLDILRQGKAVVTAVEVTRRDCLRLRRALERFVTHPNQPARQFGLLPDPHRFEGGGCISFAFYLAGAAGLMNELWPHFQREISVHPAQIGMKDAAPEGVVPYRPPVRVVRSKPLDPLTLLTSRWDVGPVIDRIPVADGELVLAGLVAMRRGVAPNDDWRFDRVLPAGDPDVAQAARAGAEWVTRYPIRRIADPQGVQALVLERR